MIQITNNINKFIEIKDFTKELNDAFILKGKRQLYFANYEPISPGSVNNRYGLSLLSIKGKGVVKNLTFDCGNYDSYAIANNNEMMEIMVVVDGNIKMTIPIKTFSVFYSSNEKIKFNINEKIIFNNSFELLSFNATQTRGLIAYTLDE